MKRICDKEYCYKSCKYYIFVFLFFRVVVCGEGGCSIFYGCVWKYDRGWFWEVKEFCNKSCWVFLYGF